MTHPKIEIENKIAYMYTAHGMNVSSCSQIYPSESESIFVFFLLKNIKYTLLHLNLELKQNYSVVLCFLFIYIINK